MVRLTAVLGSKPDPLICTLVPGGPLLGETEKLEDTVKLIEGALPMLTV
jgi:hypothetical protein